MIIRTILLELFVLVSIIFSLYEKMSKSGSAHVAAGYSLFNSDYKTSQVIETDGDTLDRILHTLKLNHEISVIARSLESVDALTHRNIAVTDDCTSEIVATPGLEEACSGVFTVAGLDMEVLCMSMDGIGSHDADRSGIIFISA